jgi:hypothetical protein
MRTRTHLLDAFPKSLLYAYVHLGANFDIVGAHLIGEGTAFGGCYLASWFLEEARISVGGLGMVEDVGDDSGLRRGWRGIGRVGRRRESEKEWWIGGMIGWRGCKRRRNG